MDASKRTLSAIEILAVALGNALLCVVVVGLGTVAVKSVSPPALPGDNAALHQAVEAHLAARLPDYRYRIREWFPPATVDTAKGTKEVAQRVTIVFYGPSGPRDLDTVFWVENGRVSHTTGLNPNQLAQESFRRPR
jgi:hypothetical protein